MNHLEKPLNFSVPTGNFGNVFACYSAYKMGMPLNKILVAVNDNNILHRFFSNNDYSKSKVSETLSPSMDISIASNFERLLYDFYAERDSSICDMFYRNFPQSPIELEKHMWEKSRELFVSYSVDDISTINAMKDTYKSYSYLIDPHTAVAIEAVDQMKEKLEGETLILSTAHPAKFPEIIKDAELELSEIPKSLLDVYALDEKAIHMSASKELIFNFIIKNNS
jgi:threonine synthase